jgi:DNA-binding NarL/FixJ family response regulator
VTIRVVLGEDSYLLREGIERIVADAPELELVGVGGDLDSLRDVIGETRPDVVITDIRMPPTGTDEGIRLASELRRSRPEVAVVVLSQHASPVYAEALLADGASGRGYVLKDRVTDRAGLLDIVRSVAAGGTHLDQEVINVVFAGWEREGRGIEALTPRETEVLALVAGGSTNAAIADELGIGKRAVERHLNSIFEKLDLGDPERVSRRVTAALAYLQATR